MSKTIVIEKEPLGSSINHKNDTYNIDLIRALNWYTANIETNMAIKYLVEAAKVSKRKKEIISEVSNLSNGEAPLALAWCVRMLMRGAVFSPTDIKNLQGRIDDLFAKLETQAAISKAKDASKGGLTPQKSIQDYIKEKVKTLLGEMEGRFDEWLKTKVIVPKATFKYFTSEAIPATYMKDISGWAEDKIREFGNALTTHDEQITEGYKNFSKKDLEQIIRYFAAIRSDANDYATHKKVNKAPRMRKAKPASVQVKRLNYLAAEPELSLVSVNPETIIGAEQLWTYHTKKKALTVYRASGSLGLGVKGSAIINYDTETSVQKSLRKPPKTLIALQDAGKIQLRKIMDTVKTKEKKPSGRISKDTVLVRVV